MAIHTSCWLGPVRKNPYSVFWFRVSILTTNPQNENWT